MEATLYNSGERRRKGKLVEAQVSEFPIKFDDEQYGMPWVMLELTGDGALAELRIAPSDIVLSLLSLPPGVVRQAAREVLRAIAEERETGDPSIGLGKQNGFCSPSQAHAVAVGLSSGIIDYLESLSSIAGTDQGSNP